MKVAAALAVMLVSAATVQAAERGGPSAPAPANERPRRVVLFPVEGDAQLSSRLTAELRAQGFQLTQLESPAASDEFAELTIAMRSTGADLALRLTVEPSVIRLWIANAATGKEVYREVPVAEGASVDSAIVSLWAVEALRASGLAPLPPSPPPSPPAPPPSPPPPQHPRSFSLLLAPGVLLSPGGMGASAQLTIAGRWLATRQLGLESFLVGPTFPLHLDRSSGSALAWRSLLALGPFLSSGSAETRTSLDLSVGGAVILTQVSGTGSDGYVGQSDQLISGGPYARVGGTIPFSRRFRVRGDAASGIAFPRPVVYFEDEQVAAWGRPWFLLSLGIEVAL